MRSFKTKRTVRSLIYSPVAAGLLFVVAIGLAHATWGAYTSFRAAHENTLRAQADLHALLARKDSLKASVEKLSTQEGVEDELRRTYGVARPGENVIVIVEPKGEKQPKQEKSGVARWWDGVKSFLGF